MKENRQINFYVILNFIQKHETSFLKAITEEHSSKTSKDSLILLNKSTANAWMDHQSLIFKYWTEVQDSTKFLPVLKHSWSQHFSTEFCMTSQVRAEWDVSCE